MVLIRSALLGLQENFRWKILDSSFLSGWNVFWKILVEYFRQEYFWWKILEILKCSMANNRDFWKPFQLPKPLSQTISSAWTILSVKIFKVGWLKFSTGWPELLSRSLSHENYTFWSKKNLLVTSRLPRSLGIQPCIPIFHIHLCTVGHQNFQD